MMPAELGVPLRRVRRNQALRPKVYRPRRDTQGGQCRKDGDDAGREHVRNSSLAWASGSAWRSPQHSSPLPSACAAIAAQPEPHAHAIIRLAHSSSASNAMIYRILLEAGRRTGWGSAEGSSTR
jgi:hypothetical protein